MLRNFLAKYMPDKKFKGLLIIAIILILSLCLYKDVIFSKERIISYSAGDIGDIANYNFSFYYLTFGFNNNHKISLWNPYVFLGEPLISHPANALFYPLNLIFFLLPLHLAINYSCFINTIFLGIAAYFYIRCLKRSRFSSLMAAIIFMLNAVVLLHIYAGHFPTMQTLPWLILLFVFTEICIQKNTLIPAVLGGLVLGIQFLAGNAQFAFYAAIAATAYFLFSAFFDYSKNKKSRRLIFYLFAYIVLVFVSLGSAAIKLIPSMEFIRFSDRSAMDLSFVGSWSFPPQNLITYLLPEFYGDMIRFPYWGAGSLWEMCGYVGILPLILSIIAVIYDRNRYTMFFGGLALVSLLGAMGECTPLFKIFYYFLPGFSKFRGHSKMIILFAFSVSVLSAFGLSWVLERKAKIQNDFKRILWPLGIFAAVAVALAVSVNLNKEAALKWWMHLAGNNNRPLDFVKGSFSIALFSLARFSFFMFAGFCVLFFWMKNKLTLRAFQFFILVLVVSDLWLFGSKYIVSEKLQECYWDRRIINFLKENGPLYNYRVMSPNLKGPSPNKAWVDGIHMIDGYDAIFLQRFLDLFYLCGFEPIDSKHNLRLLSMSNLKFLLMPKTAKLQNPALIPVYQTQDTAVWQNLKCLPRAYIVHGARVIEDKKDRVSHILFNEKFDPLRTVILEEPVSLNTDDLNLPQQPQESVEFLKYSDDEIIIQAVLKYDGYLVLSDSNYPGWKVEVLNLNTGQRRYTQPLYANHIFRAVGLKAGRYSVRFVFQPQSFYRGLKITILAVVIAALGLIWLRLKSPPKKQS